MAIEVFNRYEYKYKISQKQFLQVLEVLDEHMRLDAYNVGRRPYTIANIYFDTSDDHLVRASLNKPEYKEKLRLRSYGVPVSDAKVYLEIKKKFKGMVNKRRTTLRLEEAYRFVSSGMIPERMAYMNPQVMQEIAYFLKLYDLSPKLYLAYDRIAYFENGNNDLRISFDQNIRSRRYDLKLELGDYGTLLLPEDTVLMEIKTSRAMPIWLANMLSKLEIRRISFSKYGSEFKRYIGSIATEQEHYRAVI